MKIFRIIVIGTTGSGKTTMASNIATILQIPHIELDALHWEEQWQEAPVEVFRQRVQEVIQPESWVIDGNYSVVRDIVWSRATMVIWLDYPFLVNFWRLTTRSLRRLFLREELWNGNRERWRSLFLSKDSLFVWFFQTYSKRKQQYSALMRQPDYAHIEFIRLRSKQQARQWLQQLQSVAAPTEALDLDETYP